MVKSPMINQLKKICSDSNIDISCIVRTNGDVTASVGKVDALELETFGIMSATIFGAASTSNDQLNKKEPEEIDIKSSDGNTLIMNLSNEHLLVVRTKEDFDLDDINGKIGKYIKSIKNNIM